MTTYSLSIRPYCECDHTVDSHDMEPPHICYGGTLDSRCRCNGFTLCEVEGAEGAPGLRGPGVAAASSCSHTIRDLLAICRACETALVIEEDWQG